MPTPGEFTEEEVREKFLRKVNAIIDYWANLESVPGSKEKLEGLTFSMLGLIDGSDIELPAFILAPYPTPQDKEYLKSNGENWFAENHEANVKCDIAGALHDQLHKFK